MIEGRRHRLRLVAGHAFASVVSSTTCSGVESLLMKATGSMSAFLGDSCRYRSSLDRTDRRISGAGLYQPALCRLEQ
jgi:hypothetical protein